jgi:hypothetical protein
MEAIRLMGGILTHVPVAQDNRHDVDQQDAKRMSAICRESVRVVTMLGSFLLVLLHLTTELVSQGIDGGIQVGIDTFDVDVLAAYMDGNVGFLIEFIDGKNHVNTGDIVGMADDAFNLFRRVGANGIRDFDMMAGDVEIHANSSLVIKAFYAN